ncbi:MAG: DUF2914 domain-containing protein [Bacteriovoracia bacterium]
MVQQILEYKNRFLEFYQRHEVLVSIFVFGLGFIFDLLTLGRIDDLLNLVQQAIYLALLGSLLLIEIRLTIGTLTLSEKLKKFWAYHNLVVHFLFGSLLSAYTIFYYTSASALTSFLFILLLAGLMLANEIPKVQDLGLPVRVILYSICLLSYFSFFYPILMGHVGPLPFWLGILSSAAVLLIVWKYYLKGFEKNPILKNHVLLPGLFLHLFFILGYYSSLIPPVPVAVKKIGVYYDVEKRNGNYVGKHLSPAWKFWEKGSQDFSARPGDKVTILLSIFSPARFQDRVFLKWYREGNLEDTIPLNILGGRDEGFRGFGTKKHYSPGDWKVIVETSDGREVGRISLEIESDPSSDMREFKEDVF